MTLKQIWLRFVMFLTLALLVQLRGLSREDSSLRNAPTEPINGKVQKRPYWNAAPALQCIPYRDVESGTKAAKKTATNQKFKTDTKYARIYDTRGP